jgi:hypothetical protein
MRLSVILVALALLAGVAAPSSAKGDAGIAAGLIAGTCAAPGAVLAPLPPPTPRSPGTVLGSFATVELALVDLAGAAAVLVTDGGRPAACGEVPAGSDPDRFAAVRPQAGSDLGGVAWFHARGAQTQVSLFLARGLSGGGGDVPEPPPAEDTPVPAVAPSPTPTGASAGCEVVATWYAPTKDRISQADAIVAKLPQLLPTLGIASGPTLLDLGATLAVLADAQRAAPAPPVAAAASGALADALADLGAQLTTIGNRLNAFDPGYLDDVAGVPPLEEAYAAAKAGAQGVARQCGLPI